jgi:hypothetical protein
MEPKFCNFCQEIVHSKLCPFCERRVSDFNYDTDEAYEPEVDEAMDRWSGDGEKFTVLSFDDIDGEID